MKTITTIVIFIFIMLNAFSQAVNKQWDSDFGGTDNEQFATILQTNDGGYIAGGYTESGISGDITQGSRGSADFSMLAKL